MSGESMVFPENWEQFLRDYEFEDARRIYTNGSRLIPSFRVRQMMEHYAPTVDAAPVVHARWVWSPECCKWICSNCRGREGECESPVCKWCGARMDGGEEHETD